MTNPNVNLNGGTPVLTSANSIASASSEAISKERQLHKAAHKASDENKPFDPGGEYSPAAVTAASLEESCDRVLVCAFVFSFA